MTVLNDARALYLGERPVSAAYLGAQRVWPVGPEQHPYVGEVLADDPAGYWRLTDDPASGVAADASGYGYDAAIVGAIPTVPHPFSSAEHTLGFNTPNGYVYLPESFNVGFGSTRRECTVEYWRAQAPAVNSFSFTLAPNTIGTNQVFRCVDPDTAGGLRWDATGAEPGLNRIDWPYSATAVPLGTWRHVVLRLNTNSRQMIVDGVQRAASNVGPNSVDLYGGWLGNGNVTDTQYARAGITEFAIYRHYLSDARIAAHYDAARASWLGP